MRYLFEQLTAIATAAAQKMPEAMTEAEKVALAFAAGCSIDTEINGTTVRLSTRFPVGIVHDGRRLIVAVGTGPRP